MVQICLQQQQKNNKKSYYHLLILPDIEQGKLIPAGVAKIKSRRLSSLWGLLLFLFVMQMMQDKSRDIRLSKALSYFLRHGPKNGGPQLMNGNFTQMSVNITELLNSTGSDTFR